MGRWDCVVIQEKRRGRLYDDSDRVAGRLCFDAGFPRLVTCRRFLCVVVKESFLCPSHLLYQLFAS